VVSHAGEDLRRRHLRRWSGCELAHQAVPGRDFPSSGDGGDATAPRSGSGRRTGDSYSARAIMGGWPLKDFLPVADRRLAAAVAGGLIACGRPPQAPTLFESLPPTVTGVDFVNRLADDTSFNV